VPGPDQLAELQQRIHERRDAGDAPSPPASAARREIAPRRSGFALGVALGALATAIVAVLWNYAAPDPPDGNIAESRDEPPPAFAWLSDAQLSDKAILRDEMVGLFDRQFGWFAETARGMEVGVDDRPGDADSRSAAIRVIVERRAIGGDWNTVWAIDVVARSEQRIEIVPDSDDLSGFTLWAYVLPDGMVSVDTGLTLTGSAPVTAERLQRDGEPEVIYSTTTDGYEVRVLQAAAALES
jgi:hypothetical protein